MKVTTNDLQCNTGIMGPLATVEPATARVSGPELIAPPPLVYAVPWLLGLLLDRLLPLPRLSGAIRRLGLPLTAAGVGLSSWFVAVMFRAGTSIDPRQAPTTLVQDGPFRYTRNPGYLGLALAYVGASLLRGARWSLILLPGVLLAVDRGVIRREERYLEERFGSDYRAYMSRVRRWI